MYVLCVFVLKEKIVGTHKRGFVVMRVFFSRLLLLAAVFTFSGNALSGTIPSEVCDLWDHSLTHLGVKSSGTCFGAYGGLTCPSRTCCLHCYEWND
mmetsp:Transcript_17133/g.39643  ORF Transcript_17133/g.39643 Transcript_17133/m.39643 type:complete len:96 (+) Transcript_17133:1959-2246(+)